MWVFMILKMPKLIDGEARRATLALLARGMMRPHEVAELAGVSLQVVRYWCRRAGVDWERIRDQRNADAWRKELNRGPRLVQEQAARAVGANGARYAGVHGELGACGDGAEQGGHARGD